MKNDFTPKLFTLLQEGIPAKQWKKDLLSGLVVGIVALPLAIAFAIASGVPPEKGLITAIIAGFIISAFGGSRVQIGGPTGAFIILVYGVVAQYGIDGLVISTFMAGFIIIGFGIAKLGNYLKFIPYPLIVGFTSGIAVIIFTSQLKDLFGLQDALPADFIGKWNVYAHSWRAVDAHACLIGLIAVVITAFAYRIISFIPGSLIAIVVCLVLVQWTGWQVPTIENTLGVVRNTFDRPHIPRVDYATIRELIQPAFAIAVLGAIESLLSAVVADGMIGGKHRPNAELIAQGGANIISALFGGIPATGAIARTATNVKNGGRTPIAGMVHAITLCIIMLFFAPYAGHIPLSCLAGILLVVAYNMSEWRNFKHILKSKSLDITILLTTFFLTIFFDLIIAIEVGLVLSSFLFMKRMSETPVLSVITAETNDEDVLFQKELKYDSEKIIIYEINGPLFFGAARQFQEVLSRIHKQPKYIILRMRNVPFIDQTGYRALRDMIRQFESKHIQVLLSGVRPELSAEFESRNIYALIPRERIFLHIDAALLYAQDALSTG
ncbi:MAG: SulP family inorganic anion transporter [Chitinophagales bacterium]